jgi:hypothetical protein
MASEIMIYPPILIRRQESPIFFSLRIRLATGLVSR